MKLSSLLLGLAVCLQAGFCPGASVSGSASGEAAGGLSRIVPVWVEEPAGVKDRYVSFRSSFEGTEAGAFELTVAASTVYRVYLNGAFVGWGPARTVYGFACVDRWPLKARPGRNALVVEVAGYRFESFQYSGGEPFFAATVTADGRSVAATPSGFEAVETPRAKTGPVYSRQRGFVAEAYEVDRDWTAWTSGGASARPRLKVVPVAGPKLLPRAVPYPDFTLNEGFRPDRDAKGGEIYALGTIDSGFVGLRVTCTTPGRLAVEFDEALGTNGVIDLRRNGDPLVSWHAMYNRLVWDVKEPGDYVLETIEPYTLKFARIAVESGAFAGARPYLRRCRHAKVAQADFRSDDPELDALFAAAKESLAQNGVDFFTDCPSRERVGWLCDTFFSAETAAWLTGDFSLEREYLLNFTRTDDFGKDIPRGAIPGFMPSRRGGVMPTYMMWYALQCCAAAERMDAAARQGFLAAVRPRIEGVFGWLGGFEREGLLENLPGWVFIEWSKANSYVKGVNFPANMLWAQALERSGRLFGRADWIAKAGEIRGRVMRLSYDGSVFHDQALRGKDGRLVRTEDAKTETCQYYAFFTGLVTAKSHPALWRMLVDELGPSRTGHDDMATSDVFIGWMLRMDLLSRAGEAKALFADMKKCYGAMAAETGAFWEFADGHDSRCHAFGSYLAVLILREALGIVRIDWANRTVYVRSQGVSPKVRTCTIPVSGGAIAVKAGRLILPEGWRAVPSGSR